MSAFDGPRALIPASGGLGVLAALRDLGREGITTMIGRPALTSPLRPSRYATWPEAPIPSSGRQEQTLSWLLRAVPPGAGTVLIPAPDDVVWLASERQSQLQDRYRLYYPSGETMYALLNKERLHAVALASGVAVPDSWFPTTREEAIAMARTIGAPLVMKPRTHVGIRGWTKGQVATSWEEAPRVYDRAVARLRYDPLMVGRDPSIRVPFLQRYHPGASAAIYNLTGFIDQTGDLTGFSATRKVLQYPRRLGVGVCFEAAPVLPELASRLKAMLRRIGFHGIFEAEFIDSDGDKLLIDFNPRLFQSVGFVVARGLRLPLIWFLAANGDWARIEQELAAARRGEDGAGQPSRWVHRFALETMVAARLASFRMGPREARDWLGWLFDPRTRTMDATWAPDDPWPGRLNGPQHLALFAGDPRFLFGTFIRD